MHLMCSVVKQWLQCLACKCSD